MLKFLNFAFVAFNIFSAASKMHLEEGDLKATSEKNRKMISFHMKSMYHIYTEGFLQKKKQQMIKKRISSATSIDSEDDEDDDAYKATSMVLAVKATCSAEPAQAFGKAAGCYSKQ